MNGDMNDKPILELDNIHTFYGHSHILHGIHLTLKKGETLALMGRNGMGKTTLLRSILGLNPPKEGTIKIFGNDVRKMPANKIARLGVAFVPEDRGIFPNLSVHENLIMAERPGLEGRLDWTLERVLDLFPRLHERLQNMGNQLSGGEQQMLTVGRALMTNPELILLDEATEGLAPLLRKEIWTVIRKIKETGMSSVVVDKDIQSLLKLADQNVILEKGTVVYQGQSADLSNQPQILHQYLGV